MAPGPRFARSWSLEFFGGDCVFDEFCWGVDTCVVQPRACCVSDLVGLKFPPLLTFPLQKKRKGTLRARVTIGIKDTGEFAKVSDCSFKHGGCGSGAFDVGF